MELTAELVKEFQLLANSYKTGFDLTRQEVTQLVTQVQGLVGEVRELREELKGLAGLQKDVIAENDVQVQRLIKATAALTVIATQLVERFNSTRQAGA
jgi:uncharacterized protein involved in exopolysaccharide biosynthesis